MGADAIFFPELSLTGYEPKLAKELATSVEDKRFDVFQVISDRQNIAIGIGIPIARPEGVAIGMVIVKTFTWPALLSRLVVLRRRLLTINKSPKGTGSSCLWQTVSDPVTTLWEQGSQRSGIGREP